MKRFAKGFLMYHRNKWREADILFIKVYGHLLLYYITLERNLRICIQLTVELRIYERGL